MPSFFGDLPLELRIPIYEELLTKDTAVDAIEPGIRIFFDNNSDLHPAILRTCRQAYAEAIHFLYEENQFAFGSWGYSRPIRPLQPWQRPFERMKHLQIIHRDFGITSTSLGSYQDNTENLLHLTRLLAGLNCSLESLHLAFRFDDQEYFVEDDNYTDEEYEVAHFIAGDKELSKAIASFSVNKVVEITVNSCDVKHCETMKTLVNAVGSMKQWAVTVHKRTEILKEAEEGDNDGEGSDENEEGREEATLEGGEVHDDSRDFSHENNHKNRGEEEQQGEHQEESHVTNKGDDEEPPEDHASENNSGDDGDESDESDESEIERSIWTFTLTPPTPSTQGNIPELPFSHKERKRIVLKFTPSTGGNSPHLPVSHSDRPRLVLKFGI